MNETTMTSRRRQLWVGAGAARSSLRASARPTATPSPGITLRAADPAAGSSRPADPTSSTAPTQAASAEEVPVAGGVGAGVAEMDEAAQQQAYDAGVAAVLAVVAQPADEGAEQRAERLAGYFAPGSATPAAAPPLDLVGIGLVSLGRVEAAGVAWSEPFDPGDGRVGLVVGVTAVTYGMREGGDELAAWKDESLQAWKVLLAHDGAVWVPQVAYLADQDEPNGEGA